MEKLVFITGSTDGLGFLAARHLVESGHQVVLHARNAARAKEAEQKLPAAKGVVIADLSSIKDTIELAGKINSYGNFDAVIHNAGVYQVSSGKILAINTLAPYILTCLVLPPARLVYLSSDMHLSGRFRESSFDLDKPSISYSDSKLHMLLLAKLLARRWPDVYSNAVNPGWVPTKMGGRGAPDDLQKGFETQSWLAVSDDSQAQVSGQYFFHKKISEYNPEADNEYFQDELIRHCERLTGVQFPQ